MVLSVRELIPEDRPWVRTLLTERWGSTLVVSRGRAHDADRLPGYVAEYDEAKVGLLTFSKKQGGCEIVTLDALEPKRGVGTALLDAIRANAALQGCTRLWTVTTNDNIPALNFYKSRGFAVAAIHEGAMAASRKLKPEIPDVGIDGVPIRDEIEMEITRTARPTVAAVE